MALPVTVVTARGLAVTEAVSGKGLPVTVVAAGGLAVTQVASGGLPVVGLDTGSSVGPAYRMRALNGLFVFTGEPMTVQVGYSMTSQVGSFALAGQNATTIPPTATYVGPGEITGWDTAYGYWGLRAYNTSKIGTNCIDVCSNQYDTPVGVVTIKIGSNGYMDESTLPGYSPIYVARVYDQVGSQHLGSIFGTDNRPTIVLNKVGGKAAMFFGGADGIHSSAVAVAQAQPITTAAVVIPSGSGNGHVVSGGAFGFNPVFFQSSGAIIDHNFGVFSQDYTSAGLNNAGSYISVADNAASSMSVNGTITTATGGVGTNGIGTTNKFTIGAATDTDGQALNTGYVYEVMIKAGHVSTTNQGLLTANQRAIGTGF